MRAATIVLLVAAAVAGCVNDPPGPDNGPVPGPPAVVAPAEPGTLLGLVDAQVVGDDGEPRYRTPGTPGHAEALSVLRDLLVERDLEVVEETHEVVLPLTGQVNITNLIGTRVGRSEREVWLAAHWDSRALADEDPDRELRSEPCLGANDGAAAVAVVLHVLDLLPETNATIRVALFDGEDQGAGGSGWAVGSQRAVSARSDEELARIEALLLVDMPGDPDLQLRREGYGQAAAPWLHDLVFAIAAEQGATSFIDEPGPPILDDHRPFLERGVPAIDLIHLDDDERRGVFPWTHHTTHDTPENLSGERMAEVTNVLVDTVLALDARITLDA